MRKNEKEKILKVCKSILNIIGKVIMFFLALLAIAIIAILTFCLTLDAADNINNWYRVVGQLVEIALFINMLLYTIELLIKPKYIKMTIISIFELILFLNHGASVELFEFLLQSMLTIVSLMTIFESDDVRKFDVLRKYLLVWIIFIAFASKGIMFAFPKLD